MNSPGRVSAVTRGLYQHRVSWRCVDSKLLTGINKNVIASVWLFVFPQVLVPHPELIVQSCGNEWKCSQWMYPGL